MGDEGGMPLEITTGAFQTGCADVSWISKFPDEKQMLFHGGGMPFTIPSVRDIGNVQYVVLQ